MPGDKSISHRAFLLGALAHGPTRILNALAADDVERSRGAIQALGVPVRRDGPAWVVEGNGREAFHAPTAALDMGNSGTTTRLLLGILASCPLEVTLTGDRSLSSRPMRRVTDPLQKMGAVVHGQNGPDHLPLILRGGKLKGIRHVMPVASAQVKSALLLAGLGAEGSTVIVEPLPTRDHTERMLTFLGADVRRDGKEVTVYPGAKLQGRELEVPGDFSSAAFFLVAAALVPGSRVTVRGVGLNPTRAGLLEILKNMGADVRVSASPGGWEPVGDVEVQPAPLKAVTLGPELVPMLIDELPILMVAATQAQGVSRMEGVGELRVKETDRIRSMVMGLSAMGAKIRSEEDTVIIEGSCRLKGAHVGSFGDHRTAMALAVAGLTAQGITTVGESEWVSISFPDFARILRSIRR